MGNTGSRTEKRKDPGGFKLPFFGNGSSIEVESLGNLFVLRLLELMYTFGYEFILSSDLSSIHGQSSLFFRLADQVSQNNFGAKIKIIYPRKSFVNGGNTTNESFQITDKYISNRYCLYKSNEHSWNM